MKTPLTLALAAALGLSAAAPTFAQDYSYDSDYQQRLRAWQAERDAYESRRAAYDAERAAWEARNARGYDTRYDDRYGRDYPTYSRGDDPYWAYRNSDCERRARSNDSGTAAGALIGAIAGGALGSNVAARKNRSEGAVLGAVVGGALGAAIGRQSDGRRYAAACDTAGYYYNYSQTYPYREDSAYRSGRYDYGYYSRERCRLAIAPSEWDGQVENRYVRVCPDRQGRYRITP